MIRGEGLSPKGHKQGTLLFQLVAFERWWQPCCHQEESKHEDKADKTEEAKARRNTEK